MTLAQPVKSSEPCGRKAKASLETSRLNCNLRSVELQQEPSAGNAPLESDGSSDARVGDSSPVDTAA
eukprot:scaffold113097_cov71-Phaeocystis_antarctica.AAC.2